MNYRYGFHFTKLPSMFLTIKRIIDNSDVNAAQLYISNSRSFQRITFNIDDFRLARKYIEVFDLYVCIHGCLLYNLAGSVNNLDQDIENKIMRTLDGLISELDIGVAIHAGVVVHIGACQDRKVGMEIISSTINTALTRITPEAKKIAVDMNISITEFIKRRKIILENSAGEGNKLGRDLNEIAQIISGVREDLRPQVKVCIDTAHAFGAGIYDWGVPGEIQKFYDDFAKIIGMQHLELFHLNDSMISEKKANNAPFGSKKDRHQNLTLGYIFNEKELSRKGQLITFFEYAKKYNIKIIGEPPGRKSEKDNNGEDDLTGGYFDWEVITKLLNTTEVPLFQNAGNK